MKNTFFKDESPELCKTENIKTLKQNTEYSKQKTENLIHNSGNEVTSKLSSSSNSSLRSTRGASASSEVSTEDLYKDAARFLQKQDVYYIKVCLKGKKTPHRCEVNVDIVLEEDSKHIYKYKSNMVNKQFKYEIFRDLLPNETGPAWTAIKNMFDYHDNSSNMFAGKLRNRRTYRSIPKGRIPNCAIAVTPNYEAHIWLGANHHIIDLSETGMTQNAKMIFMCEGSITNYVAPNPYELEEL